MIYTRKYRPSRSGIFPHPRCLAYCMGYSIVRVNPWLEDVYGSQWDIHERIREIAGELADLIKDPAVALEDRVGYVADLMETYLTYSDMDFLDIALDAAYGIISPERNGEIVLPCRTPEMCRLLCSCYYFTGEEECAKLAKEIVKEFKTRVLEYNLTDGEVWAYLHSFEFYANIVGEGEVCEYVVNHLKDKMLFLLKSDVMHETMLSQVLHFNLMPSGEYVTLENN